MAPVPISKSRIESLSDLVFGLALSIGAIVLIQNIPPNVGDLQGDLFQFALSFLILISLWLAYTRGIASMGAETAPSVALNALLLVTVALEPYLLYLSLGGSAGVSSVSSAVASAAGTYFALDIGLALTIVAVFHILAALAHIAKRDLPHIVQQGRAIAFYLVAALVFFVSAAPFFATIFVAGAPLRDWLWSSILVIRIPVMRSRVRVVSTPEKEPTRSLETQAR